MAISLIISALLLTSCSNAGSQQSDSTSTPTPQTPSEQILSSRDSFSDIVTQVYQAYAGKDGSPSTNKVTLSLSPDGKYVTVNIQLNDVDYTGIAMHQYPLVGRDFGDHGGNPYCGKYDRHLLMGILEAYNHYELPLPTVGIYVNINRYSIDSVIDKYGHSKNKVTQEVPVKFGISTADFKKVLWGSSYNLRELSTLVRFSDPDVSWCDSNVSSGGRYGRMIIDWSIRYP